MDYMERSNYTREEREAALDVSLTGLAGQLGYTPVRKGSCYFLKEMDSLMIKNDRTWCRFSRLNAGNTEGRGGTQIDFMLQFGGCRTVPEAIHTILELNSIYVLRAEPKTSDEIQMTASLRLPDAMEDKYGRLYAYLCKTRKLSPEVVGYFVRDLKILYESREHHNLVFLGKNKTGEVKYAMQRGTCDIYGKAFKSDVSGSDKNYGVNIVNEKSCTVKVFESSIDCMSYIDIYGDYESNKLVLGMLSDRPLLTFLNEHKNIKHIEFCLDNDVPARTAVMGASMDGTEGYMAKYEKMGYMVTDSPAEPYGKDYNENLKYYRERMPEMIGNRNKYRTR